MAAAVRCSLLALGFQYYAGKERMVVVRPSRVGGFVVRILKQLDFDCAPRCTMRTVASEITSLSWYQALAPFVERADISVALKRPIRLAGGEVIAAVPGIFMRYPRWTGSPFVDDFGKKSAAMVRIDDEHLFAELAVLRLLQSQDPPWSGRWVNTYGGRGEVWKYLTDWRDVSRREQTNRPIQEAGPRRLLSNIARANEPRRFAGCWDTFVWRLDEVVFFESKRTAPKYRDVVRDEQEDWLRAALTMPDTPLSLASFCFIQWNYQL
jgi:hypothetical protein